jgi:hypothetical protein
MNVTFYNGFNPGCDLSGFKVTGGNLAEPFPIQFDPNFMNSELPILESGKNYTIEGKEIVCEGGKTFKIPSFQFPGKPPAVSTSVYLSLCSSSPNIICLSFFFRQSICQSVSPSICWQTVFFKQEIEDEDGDDAIGIFFSVDLNNPSQGLISVSENRERISKSDTGFPFVK